MPVEQQRCGTCRRWDKISNRIISGYCKAPLPFFMPVGIDPRTTCDDGKDCPCYKPNLKETPMPTKRTKSERKLLADMAEFEKWWNSKSEYCKGDDHCGCCRDNHHHARAAWMAARGWKEKDANNDK